MKQRRNLRTEEILSFYESPVVFAMSGCVKIQDAKTQKWATYEPWPIQLELLETIHENGKVACLKSRQLGVTWTCLVYVLWRMTFDPIATVGIFSIGGREARDALTRLIGMHSRLPNQIRLHIAKRDTQKGIFQLYNPDGDKDGSIAYSLPTTAGEGLSLNTVLADEAGRSPGYSRLMGNVMPAIDDSIAYGTGKVMAVGIFDKQNPNETYRAQIEDGLMGNNGWTTLFFPWNSRPGRTQEWFDAKKAEMEKQHGSDDVRKQQYPETIEEALSPPESDRRISDSLIKNIYVEKDAINVDWGIPGLTVYEEPIYGETYVAAADPSGGESGSDDSTTAIFKKTYGVPVAMFSGKMSEREHAIKSLELSDRFGGCAVFPPRNPGGEVSYEFLYGWNKNRPDKKKQKVLKRPNKHLLHIAKDLVGKDDFELTKEVVCEYFLLAMVVGGKKITIAFRKTVGDLVAVIKGKFEPGIHAINSFKLCQIYNNASMLPERNNHGSHFIGTWHEQGSTPRLIDGLDGKPGWYNSLVKKTLAYDSFVGACGKQQVSICDPHMKRQLSMIKGSTLSAPNGKRFFDDLAIAGVLGVNALLLDKDTVSGATI